MAGEIDHKIWIDNVQLKGIQVELNWVELLEFVETLRHECENKSLYEAWQFCGGFNEWYSNWPHLMKLWQKILVIPLSIAICEGDFKTKMLSRATCKVHYAG